MKSKEIILYLEDRRADALLVKRSLQSLPFPFRFIHARTKEQYLEYLRDKQPSIILVDYQVPGYDGLSAIRDARHYRPYTPIVVVTGSIGEEAAVQCIQAGASDFVLKDQRARLIAVIDNVLVQWRARRKIKESEEKYRSLFIGSREGVIVVDRKGKVLEINPAFENITGLSSRTLVGKGAYTLAKTFVSLDDLPRVVRIINDALLGHDIPPFDLHWRNKILEITVPAVANVFGRAAVVRDVTEERRQYSALAESEARYRDLVENTNDLLCVHDLEGRFLMVNRAVCRRLRYSKETLLKKNLRDVLAPDVKDQFYLYLDTIRKEKRATGIMKVRDRYGKIYIWEYNNSLNESGETPVVRGIAHDITEVYEATRKLKASEARYRDLVENSHDIIYLHDEFGILIWVNEAIRRILGFSPRRFERSNIRTFIQKPYLHEWDDYLVRIRSEGKAEGYVRLLDRQGKEHILEYRAVRQSQPEGPPLYQGIARDVTEQIHNLERLEEREAEFRSLYENATIGVYRTTPDGNILLANPRLVEMLGYRSLKQLQQRNLEAEGFEPGYDRTRFKRQVETKEGVRGWETTWIRADGTPIFVRENARAIRDSKGNLLYYEGTVEDITDWKESREQAEQLLRYHRSLNEFSRKINRLTTRRRMYRTTYLELKKLLPIDGFILSRYEEKDGLIRADYVVADGSVVDPRKLPPIPLKPAATGVQSRVIRSGKPRLVRDWLAEVSSANEVYEVEGSGEVTPGKPAAESSATARAAIVVPLKSGKRVLGCLILQRKVVGGYSEDHLTLAHSFGNILAVALENMDLVTELKRRSRQLAREVERRRIAQETLERSHERYRILFEDSPISLWEEDYSALRDYFQTLRNRGVKDLGRYFDDHPGEIRTCVRKIQVLNVNRATLAMYHARSKTELLQGLDRIGGGKYVANFRKDLVALFQGELSLVNETEFSTVDGRRLAIIVHRFIPPAYAESWSRVLVAVQDITDRKRMEAALHTSREEFRRLTETAPLAIIGIDEQSRVTVWNRAARALFGYTEREARGKEIQTLIIPREFRSTLKAGLREFRRTGGGPLFDQIRDTTACARGGERIPVSMSISAFETSRGWQGTLIVQDLRQMRAQQKEIENLAALVHHSPDLVAIIGLDGRVQFLNEGGKRLVGLGTRDYTKLLAGEFMPAEDKEYQKQSLMPRILQGESFTYETHLRHFQTGEVIPVLAHSFPLRDPQSGRPVLVATVQRDIRHLIAARQNLERHVEELELLQEVNQAILRREPFPQIVQTLARSFRQLVQVDLLNFYIFNRDRSRLINMAQIGFRQEMYDQIKQYIPHVVREEFVPRLRPRSRLARAIREGQAFYTTDRRRITAVFRDFEFTDPIRDRIPEIVRNSRTRAIGAVPLGAGPDCLGLVVYNSLRELSREEQDRIRRLVSQMAAALTYLQAEERLRERDERFRSLLDTAHDAIIGMDQNWNINIWNTAAESLFGYSPAEALGKPLHALLVFPEDLISSPEEGLKEFQKSGTGPLVGQTVEVVGRHRSGERIPVELSVSAYRLGDHWMATGILRDIRERKRAERIRETLARITHRLTVRLSPEQIGPIIAGEIRRLIPFHAFGLYELDWDRSVMRSLYNEDTPEGGRHPVPVEGGVQSFHTMNFKDVLQGKSILKNRTRVPNLSTLSPFGFEHRASLSLLFAPIIWNDKAIGYITIQSYDRGAYQRLDLQVLEMVAGQISGAFQRARAEQTLLIQQTAIEQNPASIIVTDPNGTIQYVNPGFTRIIGYEAREVLGKNPRMWKSGKHDRAFYQHLWNTIKSGQVWTGELCNRRKGGELYWESASIAPVVDRDGRILRFVAVKEDITPQIEARRRLAESERRLRTIVNALPLGVVIHQDGKLVLANPYAVENLGYDSAEEILGRSLAEFIHPDDREASARRIGHILKTGEDMVSARTRVLTRDGRVIDTFTHGARVTYGGKPAVVVGVVDITESIRQEKALRASEEKFRTLFEESRDAIYISRESGELLEFNPATRKLFGYSRKELKHINVTSLYVDAEDRKRFQREIKRVGYVQEFATRLRKKDGTILHALITAVRRETPEGVVFQGIIRDVTRDIRNRQKLEQALQQAQVADRVKTLFLANMSHEIRTPLNSLLGFMEYIEAEFRDQASPEVQAMFDALHDSGARIVHTIHEILDLSTIEAGGFELHPGEIHLKQLIDQVVRELRLRADQKGLYLDVEYGVRDDRIQGDAYSLEQALVNLVDNAIKYTEEGGVTLQLSEHRSELILSIQDTGIGMSKTYQRRMWESFSQESTGYTKKFQGVGLGLALVKRYCDLNQVDIDVFSQKGVGSTFTLTFKKPRGKSEGKQPKHHEDRE